MEHINKIGLLFFIAFVGILTAMPTQTPWYRIVSIIIMIVLGAALFLIEYEYENEADLTIQKLYNKKGELEAIQVSGYWEVDENILENLRHAEHKLVFQLQEIRNEVYIDDTLDPVGDSRKR